jgi:hypothetical protein
MTQWCKPGQTMCCLCFDCFDVNQLHQDSSTGIIENVCIECWDMEMYIERNRNEDASGLNAL